MLKEISQTAYASKMRVSVPSVIYRRVNKIKLPGVKRIKTNKKNGRPIFVYDTETKLAEARRKFK